ncbi:hypothetical protein GW17_00048381 [Ensete ventricosum]|nr:hypothetical protein GW17_00048381 [Ensete ventricosum]
MARPRPRPRPLARGGWLRQGPVRREANDAHKRRQPPAGAVPTSRSAAGGHGQLRPACRGDSCLQRGAHKGGRL